METVAVDRKQPTVRAKSLVASKSNANKKPIKTTPTKGIQKLPGALSQLIYLSRSNLLCDRAA